MLIVSKWHSKVSLGRNTFTNNCCAQIHHFILQGSFMAADDRSRNNSTTLECQSGRNNEVNYVTVRGFTIDAGLSGLSGVIGDELNLAVWQTRLQLSNKVPPIFLTPGNLCRLGWANCQIKMSPIFMNVWFGAKFNARQYYH